MEATPSQKPKIWIPGLIGKVLLNVFILSIGFLLLTRIAVSISPLTSRFTTPHYYEADPYTGRMILEVFGADIAFILWCFLVVFLLTKNSTGWLYSALVAGIWALIAASVFPKMEIISKMDGSLQKALEGTPRKPISLTGKAWVYELKNEDGYFLISPEKAKKLGWDKPLEPEVITNPKNL